MDNILTENHFKDTFFIGKRRISKTDPCLVIAEAGVAHFGDMGLARELVELAAEGNADVFKIQAFDVDTLFVKHAVDWKDRLRPRNLTIEQVFQVKELCEKRGLLFMMTPHDETRIKWLTELKVPAIKIGSGEKNNTPFIEKLCAMGKPIILSTGMYSEKDVFDTIETIRNAGCQELALLHCVSAYPTPDSDVCLKSIDFLSEIFNGPVGYSDHTVDFLAVYGAVARGAKIIEKHITILSNVPNAQDWKVSATPDNFSQLVKNIRRMESMLGDSKKDPAKSETAAMHWALKSLVARHDLPQGHRITEADLIAKRPGGGISPNQLDQVIGMIIANPLPKDEAINWDNLSSENL